MTSRARHRVLAAASAVALLVTSACSGSSNELGHATGEAVTSIAASGTADTTFENRFGSRTLSYTATWFINPGPAGRDVPTEPYQYGEFVSDAEGNYRIQTPKHYAIQSVNDVFICATEGIITCARAPRQQGAPNTASIAVTTLREFSPESIYEVSGDLALRVAEIREPEAWSSNSETHGDNVPVRCWVAIGPTSTAPLGFRVCYTDDEARLMASLDYTGDGTLEVDLVTYFGGTDAAQFTSPASFQDDERVYEQLVDLFPDVPIPPEPTPDPDNPVEAPTGEGDEPIEPTAVPTPILPAETPPLPSEPDQPDATGN